METTQAACVTCFKVLIVLTVNLLGFFLGHVQQEWLIHAGVIFFTFEKWRFLRMNAMASCTGNTLDKIRLEAYHCNTGRYSSGPTIASQLKEEVSTAQFTKEALCVCVHTCMHVCVFAYL